MTHRGAAIRGHATHSSTAAPHSTAATSTLGHGFAREEQQRQAKCRHQKFSIKHFNTYLLMFHCDSDRFKLVIYR
jgi:hypothetical protein